MMVKMISCPSHCCPVHGCKYGYNDCPVYTGKVQPEYPRNNGCEMCEQEPPIEEVMDQLVPDWQEIAKRYPDDPAQAVKEIQDRMKGQLDELLDLYSALGKSNE